LENKTKLYFYLLKRQKNVSKTGGILHVFNMLIKCLCFTENNKHENCKLKNIDLICNLKLFLSFRIKTMCAQVYSIVKILQK